MNDFGPKHINHPREGFYKVRARRRRDGEAWDHIPWCPVWIYRPLPLDPSTGEIIDRWPQLEAERGDRLIEDNGELLDLWPYCREITREEYEWLKKVEWPLLKRTA